MTEQSYYLVEGVKYPRVSRILSILREPQVEAWRAKTPDAEEQSAEARKLGTQVHAYIAADLRGESWKLPKTPTPQLMNAIQAYQAWKRERLQVVLAPTPVIQIEQTFTNHGYGGTVDLILNDRLIIDWKIASAIRPKHWIQTHAYVPLVWPEQPLHRQVQVIRLDKDLGIYEAPAPREFAEPIWTTFMHLKRVYEDWYADTDYKEAP